MDITLVAGARPILPVVRRIGVFRGEGRRGRDLEDGSWACGWR
jgi:hypothetical protein